MLEESGMPKAFWPEAHEYANLTHNMSPSQALTKVTPHEAFWGKKPNVSTLRIFGSKCHVCIAPEVRKKLDAHSLDGIFCSFTKNSKSYQVWIHKFYSCQDVIIYEKVYSPSLTDFNDQPVLSEGVPSILPGPLPDLFTTETKQGDPENTLTPHLPKQNRSHPPEESHPNPDEPHQPQTTQPTWK